LAGFGSRLYLFELIHIPKRAPDLDIGPSGGGGRMTDKAIEAIRKEIVALTAENLAMQFVLTSLLQRISEGNPSMRRLILQALDEAANHTENFSIVRGAKAGHLPETLRIIEQMRLMLVGKGKLKRDQ
jgi:hypothetical protein